MVYTTQNLLDSIARRSFAPTNQLTFQNQEILEMADEETQITILPQILAVREEYFVGYKDYPILAGKSAYDIPARAIGLIVREVQIINSSNSVMDIPRMEPEEISTYSPGSISAFYLRANQVVLNRTPTSTQSTLRLYFFLRPGDLVETSQTAVVSNIDPINKIVTVGTIPNTWATGMIFDFLKQDGGHDYLTIDNTATNVSSNQLTFDSLPENLRVGDYVALQGQSSLVQLPPEYRSVLAQLVAATMLANMNQPGADMAAQKAVTMLKAAQGLITPRVHGEDRTIQPVNWF
jgi:hypothetical protein